MHYTIVAVIPFQSGLRNDLEKRIKEDRGNLLGHLAGKLEKPLSVYDYDKKMTPYKEYYSDEKVHKIIEGANININDQSLVFQALKEYNSDLSAGKDEKGYYVMRDTNQQGMFDYCNVYDVCFIEEALAHEDFVEHAIFTPDCKIIQSEHWFFSVGKSNENEYEQWKKQFQDKLKSYSRDSLLVFVDCHC